MDELAFIQALSGFLAALTHERQASPYTTRNYELDLIDCFHFLATAYTNECATPQAVTDVMVREYIATLFRQKKKPATIARKISALRSFFRYLTTRKLIAHNPAEAIRMPKLPRQIPKFLTLDEIDRLLTSAHSPRDQAILELLYASGIRVQELVTLDLEHVDWEGRLMRVYGKGKKERMVPIGRKAMTALGAYLPERQPADSVHALFLNRFGKRLSERSIERFLDTAARTAHLDRRLTPHVLRHTFATHMMNAGADLRLIQELLGHAHLSTTQCYTHLDLVHLMKIYDAAHPKA